MVFSAAGVRGEEATKAAELFTAGSDKEIVLKDYRDGFLPYDGGKVKECFEEIEARVNPDLILYPHWSGSTLSPGPQVSFSELTWRHFATI